MKESHIDTRTPDEMLDGAVERMFKIGEWHLKAFPRLKLEIGKEYYFSFDKKATYIYKGQHSKQYYPDGYCHLFERTSDKAPLYSTKYSDSPEEIYHYEGKK